MRVDQVGEGDYACRTKGSRHTAKIVDIAHDAYELFVRSCADVETFLDRLCLYSFLGDALLEGTEDD